MVSWLVLLTQLLGGILAARCALNHPENYSGFLDPKPPEIPCIHPPSMSNEDKAKQVQLRLDIGPSKLDFNDEKPESRIQVDREESSSEGSSATSNPIMEPPPLESRPRCTSTYPNQGSVPASDVTQDSTPKPTDQNGQESHACSVCLEEMITDELNIVSLLGCQHRFHRDCIAKCVESKHLTCPYCREKLAREGQGLKVRDVSNNEEIVLRALLPSGLLTSNDVQLGLSTSNHVQLGSSTSNHFELGVSNSNHVELGLPTSNRFELGLPTSNHCELSACIGILFFVIGVFIVIWYFNKYSPQH